MKYWLGENMGAGFIKSNEHKRLEIRGYAGNIWVTNDRWAAGKWAERNNLTEKTKEEATSIQESAIADNVVAWNNISDADIKGTFEPSEEAIP
jgi:phage terminase large subunit